MAKVWTLGILDIIVVLSVAIWLTWTLGYEVSKKVDPVGTAAVDAAVWGAKHRK